MRKTIVAIVLGLASSAMASDGISLDLFRETGIFTGYMYEVRGNSHLSANYKSVVSYKDTIYIVIGGGVNPSEAIFQPAGLVLGIHGFLWHLGLKQDWLNFTKSFYGGYSIGWNQTAGRVAHGGILSLDLLKLFRKGG